MKINSLGITPYASMRNQQKEYNNISFKQKNDNRNYLAEDICILSLLTLPYLIAIPSTKYIRTPNNCRDINRIVCYLPKEINNDKENIKINNFERSANSVKFDANINGKNTNIKLELNNISQTETEGKATIKNREKCEIADVKIKNIAPDVFECKFNNRKLFLNNNKGKITIKDEEGKIMEEFKLDVPYKLLGFFAATAFLIGVLLLKGPDSPGDYCDNGGCFD